MRVALVGTAMAQGIGGYTNTFRDARPVAVRKASYAAQDCISVTETLVSIPCPAERYNQITFLNRFVPTWLC